MSDKRTRGNPTVCCATVLWQISPIEGAIQCCKHCAIIEGKFAHRVFNHPSIVVSNREYLVSGDIFGDKQLRVSVGADGATVDGRRLSIEQQSERGVWVARTADGELPVYIEECSPTGKVSLAIRGYRYSVQCYPAAFEELLGKVRQFGQHDQRNITVRAPMPGLVKAVNVAVGAMVRKGESIIVLEAMKMENLLRAPVTGIVRTLAIAAGSTVEKGDLLCMIELDGVR